MLYPFDFLPSPYVPAAFSLSCTIGVILFSYLLERLYPIISRLEPHLTPSPFWATHVRLIVYTLALGWAVFLLLDALPAGDTLGHLASTFGLSAIFLLFIVLTPGLLRVYFPHFFLNSILLVSRRALGVSMFFFAALHAGLAFIYAYGGSLTNLISAQSTRQVAFILGASALLIFLLLALTSFDRAVVVLTFKRWKMLHRLIYPATMITIFHIFLVGPHFADRSAPLPVLLSVLALTYLYLEIGATHKEMLRLSVAPLSIRRLATLGLIVAGAFGTWLSMHTQTP